MLRTTSKARRVFGGEVGTKRKLANCQVLDGSLSFFQGLLTVRRILTDYDWALGMRQRAYVDCQVMCEY